MMSPKQYVELLDKLRTLDDFSYIAILLKYGETRPLSPCPKKHKGQFKQCFKNSCTMSAVNLDYKYCEGFAMTSIGIPIHHAWVYDSKNEVFMDPTWDDGVDYFGLIFSDIAYNRLLRATRRWGDFLYKPALVQYYQENDGKL